MLLRVLFLVVALAVAGETLLAAAGALAVSALHRRAIAAATSAFDAAAQEAQAAVAGAVVQETALPAMPSPEPSCVLANANGCTLFASETVALETPATTTCVSEACAGYVQSNDVISEGRVAASIAIRITNAASEMLAVRSGTVVFRTLRIAPYAVFSAATDATLDDGESGATAAGGEIDVIYKTAVTGAVMPANVWSGFSAPAVTQGSWSP